MPVDLTAAKLTLAERLHHACSACGGSGEIHERHEPPGYKVLECGCDHGKVYPLQEKCPGDSDSWEDADYDIEGEDSQGGAPYYNIGPVTITRDRPCKGVDCPQCEGRGWVPTNMHLEDVIAAAEICGVTVMIPWPWGDRDPGPGRVIEATRGGFAPIKSRRFKRSADSILLVAINVVLEVLP